MSDAACDEPGPGIEQAYELSEPAREGVARAQHPGASGALAARGGAGRARTDRRHARVRGQLPNARGGPAVPREHGDIPHRPEWHRRHLPVRHS